MALLKEVPDGAELVEITEIIHASAFWVTASESTLETRNEAWSKPRAQLEMLEMFLASAKLTSVPRNRAPHMQEIVAVNHPLTGKWHRGCVQAIKDPNKNLYCVFLIDHGHTVEVSASALRDIDEYYKKQEALAYRVLLFGIVPGKRAFRHPHGERVIEAVEWTPEANAFVKNQIAKSSMGYFCQKGKHNSANILFGDLYLAADEGFLDLGLLLCKQKYAISNVHLFLGKYASNLKAFSENNSNAFISTTTDAPTKNSQYSHRHPAVMLSDEPLQPEKHKQKVDQNEHVLQHTVSTQGSRQRELNRIKTYPDDVSNVDESLQESVKFSRTNFKTKSSAKFQISDEHPEVANSEPVHENASYEEDQNRNKKLSFSSRKNFETKYQKKIENVSPDKWHTFSNSRKWTDNKEENAKYNNMSSEFHKERFLTRKSESSDINIYDTHVRTSGRSIKFLGIDVERKPDASFQKELGSRKTEQSIIGESNAELSQKQTHKPDRLPSKRNVTWDATVLEVDSVCDKFTKRGVIKSVPPQRMDVNRIQSIDTDARGDTCEGLEKRDNSGCEAGSTVTSHKGFVKFINKDGRKSVSPQRMELNRIESTDTVARQNAPEGLWKRENRVSEAGGTVAPQKGSVKFTNRGARKSVSPQRADINRIESADTDARWDTSEEDWKRENRIYEASSTVSSHKSCIKFTNRGVRKSSPQRMKLNRIESADCDARQDLSKGLWKRENRVYEVSNTASSEEGSISDKFANRGARKSASPVKKYGHRIDLNRIESADSDAKQGSSEGLEERDKRVCEVGNTVAPQEGSVKFMNRGARKSVPPQRMELNKIESTDTSDAKQNTSKGLWKKDNRVYEAGSTDEPHRASVKFTNRSARKSGPPQRMELNRIESTDSDARWDSSEGLGERDNKVSDEGSTVVPHKTSDKFTNRSARKSMSPQRLDLDRIDSADSDARLNKSEGLWERDNRVHKVGNAGASHKNSIKFTSRGARESVSPVKNFEQRKDLNRRGNRVYEHENTCDSTKELNNDKMCKNETQLRTRQKAVSALQPHRSDTTQEKRRSTSGTDSDNVFDDTDIFVNNTGRLSRQKPFQNQENRSDCESYVGGIPSSRKGKKPNLIQTFFPAGFNMAEADKVVSEKIVPKSYAKNTSASNGKSTDSFSGKNAESSCSTFESKSRLMAVTCLDTLNEPKFRVSDDKTLQTYEDNCTTEGMCMRYEEKKKRVVKEEVNKNIFERKETESLCPSSYEIPFIDQMTHKQPDVSAVAPHCNAFKACKSDETSIKSCLNEEQKPSIHHIGAETFQSDEKINLQISNSHNYQFPKLPVKEEIAEEKTQTNALCDNAETSESMYKKDLSSPMSHRKSMLPLSPEQQLFTAVKKYFAVTGSSDIKQSDCVTLLDQLLAKLKNASRNESTENFEVKALHPRNTNAADIDTVKHVEAGTLDAVPSAISEVTSADNSMATAVHFSIPAFTEPAKPMPVELDNTAPPEPAKTSPAEPAKQVFVEPTKPAPVETTPIEPDKVAPVDPAEKALVELNEPAPEEPAEPATEEPAEPATEEPAESAPEEPGEPAPEEPAEPAPEELAEPAPEEPAEPAPEEPVEPALEEAAKPALKEPAEPALEEPAEPAPEEPAEPAPEEPAEPAPEEPAEPAPEEPAQPAPEEPAQPAPEEPVEPAPEEPAEPATGEPAEPATEEPAEPALEEPAETALEEPAEPAPEEPSRPAPEEPAEPAPEEPAEPAPEKPAEPAPEELAQPAPGESATSAPEELTTPTPLELAKPETVELTEPTTLKSARSESPMLTKSTSIECSKPSQAETDNFAGEPAKTVLSKRISVAHCELAKSLPDELSQLAEPASVKLSKPASVDPPMFSPGKFAGSTPCKLESPQMNLIKSDLVNSSKPNSVSTEFQDHFAIVEQPRSVECSKAKNIMKSSTPEKDHTTSPTTTEKADVKVSSSSPQHRVMSVEPDPCPSFVRSPGRKIMDQLQLMVVLLHGAPKDFRHLNIVTDAILRRDVHEVLKTIMNRLMRIQKYAWPLIQQGHSCVIVGPPMSGKTLGYAVPLLDQVMQKVQGNEIPKGNGPVMLVLCSGSRSCNEIFELCYQFLKKCTREIKMLVAYGGGAEKIEFSLINGCHILISTPRCFKRLLQLGSVVVNFARLKYFVLDEADVLTLRFLPEVDFICKKVERDMKPQERVKLQAVAVAEKWCPGLEVIVKGLSNPVVCIGAFLEAIVYAHLKPQVHFVTQRTRISVVQEVIQQTAKDYRTLVICREVEEVLAVYEALQSSTVYPQQLMMAHHNLDTIDIHEIYVKWSWMMHPVLVCSDVILQELSFQGATQLIHFSLMDVSKREFAYRCSTLIDQLPSVFETEDAKANKMQSKMHIFISDSDSEPLPTLVRFLKRLGVTVDPDLQKRANIAEVQKDLKKDYVPLCYNTKAFGDCWNKSNCIFRHVISSADKPRNIPMCGNVKVKILHVHDVCNYSARVYEHGNEKGQIEVVPNLVTSLTRKMNSYFKDDTHRVLKEKPKAYDICAAEKVRGVYHRVEVLAIVKTDRHENPTELLVRFIDDGCRDLIKAERLFELPPELIEIPPQSVEIFLCRLVPCDLDWSWGPVTSEKVAKILSEALQKDRFLIGKIRLSLGHTLWLDPLECYERLVTLKTSTIIFSLRRRLLDAQLAVESPQHLELLSQACTRAGIEVPQYAPSNISSLHSEKSEKVDVCWAHLPTDEFSLVYFIVGDHPGRFYVRQEKFEDLVHKMDKKLTKLAKERDSNSRTLFAGDYCIGRFPTDNRWYRAHVENSQNDTLDLFFVDHGDRATVSRSDALPLPKDLITQLPFQAIECCFAGVSPDQGERWSEKSIDALYGITAKAGTVDGVKLLYAKVLNKVKPADCTGGFKYHVALIEVTPHGQALLNNTLVAWGLASQSEEQKLLLQKLDFSHLTPPMDRELSDESEDELEEEEEEEEKTLKSLDGTEIIFQDNWDCEQPEYSNLQCGELNSSAVLQSLETTASSTEVRLEDTFASFDFSAITEDEIMEFFEKSMEDYNTSSRATSNVSSSMVVEDKEELKEDSLSRVHTTVDEPGKEERNDSISNQEENPVKMSSQKCDPMCSSSVDCAECDTNSADEEDCLMPHLVRITRTPLVYWRQDAYFVWLMVDLPGVDNYYLQWDEDHVHFWTVLKENVYSFDLHLFGPILPNSLTHSGGLFVRIKMQKVLIGTDWPRLIVSPEKLLWLKRHYDAGNNSDIEEIRLAEQLRIIKEMEKKKEDRIEKGGLLPADEATYEADDSDSESSSSDLVLADEQYDPYDPLN